MQLCVLVQIPTFANSGSGMSAVRKVKVAPVGSA